MTCYTRHTRDPYDISAMYTHVGFALGRTLKVSSISPSKYFLVILISLHYSWFLGVPDDPFRMIRGQARDRYFSSPCIRGDLVTLYGSARGWWKKANTRPIR